MEELTTVIATALREHGAPTEPDDEFDCCAEAVIEALAQLDGTRRSAVRLLTGFTDEELDELGGVS